MTGRTSGIRSTGLATRPDAPKNPNHAKSSVSVLLNLVCGIARSTSTSAISAKMPMVATLRNEKNASTAGPPRV
jgi:hypothetical protein